MKEISKKIKLQKPFEVDLISVKADQYFHDAYAIDLPLEAVPDHVWQDIFERTWRSSRHLWDRKLFVIGDKLRLVTSADDFGEKLDWVEHVIEETNRRIDEYRLAVEKEEEARVQEEIRRQKQWTEKARMGIIKDTLKQRFAAM